ncbi:MAG: hypothetical protein D6B28_10120 [Gammaproteobacteria bacterium]|nr:MAG: hypothetical protein D6B28_10120 [Gammaproteobacteria bacterium]
MNDIKHLRNTLWTSKFSKQDEAAMEEVAATVEGSSSPFKELILFALENTKKDVADGNFKVAAKELSLVHELPVNEEEVEEWDFAWFYKNQLGEYFDKNKNIDRVKQVIDYLAESQKRLKQ